MRHVHLARERSLYRHPDLSIATANTLSTTSTQDTNEENHTVKPEPRYRKAYDIYSLGVVLMETGLWQPARELVRKNEDPVDFHQRLFSKLLPELRYRISKNYHDVVEKCLKGSFGKDSP
jgi:hypothetical protein